MTSGCLRKGLRVEGDFGVCKWKICFLKASIEIEGTNRS